MHGTRATYQSGCGCLPCKAANSAYVQHLREQARKGIPPLGATTSAIETWRMIRALRVDGVKKQDVAKALGLKRPILEWHHDVIKIRTQLRVRRLYRMLMLEGPDQPNA